MNIPQSGASSFSRFAFVLVLSQCAAISHAFAQADAKSASTASESAGEAKAAAAKDKGILPIPDYTGDFMDRAYLTGDWDGYRTDLAQKGIQFKVDWTQTLQSVVSGGTDTGTKYGGLLDYIVNFDFDKMGFIPGGLLKIRAESRYGKSVNGISGQFVPASTSQFVPLGPPGTDIGFAITDLTYYQFLSEEFGLFLGKFDTFSGDPNPFASGRGISQFQNLNFVFNSTLLSAVPYSTLGAGVLVMPCPNVTLSSIIMNTADSSTTTGFNEIGDGWTWLTEGDVQYRLGSLPGGQNVLFMYAGDRNYLKFGGQFEFRPGEGIIAPTQDYTWSLAWSGWQYLFTADKSDKLIDLSQGPPKVKGFGLFWRMGIADDDTNPIEWSLSGGVGGRGIIPSRDNDMFGVGYFYSGLQSNRLSSAVGFQDQSQGVECFYNFAITPAAQLTFDVQVLDSPLPDTDTAVILGGRLLLTF